MKIMIIWGVIVTAVLSCSHGRSLLCFLRTGGSGNCGRIYDHYRSGRSLPLRGNAYHRSTVRSWENKICSIISILLTGSRIPLALVLTGTSLGLTGIWWALTLTSIAKGIVFNLTFRQVSHRLEQ